MKIKFLIEKLSKLNPNSEVIISSDSEGNHYGILLDISAPQGLKFSKIDGEIVMSTRDEIDEFFTEKVYNKCKDCVVLYPN